jgi:hypothetical protein
MHFEDLWNEAESLLKDETSKKSVLSIVQELTAKISLYSALDNNNQIGTEEKKKLKFHLFGKIMMVLTSLSLKDDVNTFSALQNEIENAKIEWLAEKYR